MVGAGEALRRSFAETVCRAPAVLCLALAGLLGRLLLLLCLGTVVDGGLTAGWGALSAGLAAVGVMALVAGLIQLLLTAGAIRQAVDRWTDGAPSALLHGAIEHSGAALCAGAWLLVVGTLTGAMRLLVAAQGFLAFAESLASRVAPFIGAGTLALAVSVSVLLAFVASCAAPAIFVRAVTVRERVLVSTYEGIAQVFARPGAMVLVVGLPAVLGLGVLALGQGASWTGSFSAAPRLEGWETFRLMQSVVASSFSSFVTAFVGLWMVLGVTVLQLDLQGRWPRPPPPEPVVRAVLVAPLVAEILPAPPSPADP